MSAEEVVRDFILQAGFSERNAKVMAQSLVAPHLFVVNISSTMDDYSAAHASFYARSEAELVRQRITRRFESAAAKYRTAVNKLNRQGVGGREYDAEITRLNRRLGIQLHGVMPILPGQAHHFHASIQRIPAPNAVPVYGEETE